MHVPKNPAVVCENPPWPIKYKITGRSSKLRKMFKSFLTYSWRCSLIFCLILMPCSSVYFWNYFSYVYYTQT